MYCFCVYIYNISLSMYIYIYIHTHDIWSLWAKWGCWDTNVEHLVIVGEMGMLGHKCGLGFQYYNEVVYVQHAATLTNNMIGLWTSS